MHPAAVGAVDVRLFADFGELARDAAGALDRAAQPSLYDRIDWFGLTAAHVLAGVPLVAIRARTGDGTAWLILADRGGRRAEAYASWYTLAFAPLFAPGTAAAARPVLLAAIAHALRPHFDTIALTALRAEDATLVARAFGASGWWATEGAPVINWTAYVAGADFDSYWQDRPSRLRNTVRRKGKASTLTLEVIDRFDPLVWTAYEEVYGASWKPAEGSPNFLRGLAEMEGAAGTLRLGIARSEGRAVACQVWTVEYGVATIHKLAHLEAERTQSPGTLLSKAMFHYVIERDRPVLINFGIGDDAYKADWMSERRMLHRLTLYNRRSMGGLARAARAAGAALMEKARND